MRWGGGGVGVRLSLLCPCVERGFDHNVRNETPVSVMPLSGFFFGIVGIFWDVRLFLRGAAVTTKSQKEKNVGSFWSAMY